MGDLKIDRSRTGLVVIDLQKVFTSMEGQPYGVGSVVSNAAALAGAFRKRKMPVFLIHASPSRDAPLQVQADIPFAPRGDMPPGWADIVSELGPEGSDIVITKRQWGAFYGTDLELRLRRGGVDTIVLCGIATTYGVESTARFAYEYGFQQIFAEDAMTDFSAEAHTNSVESVLKRIGRVRKTSEIIESLS